MWPLLVLVESRAFAFQLFDLALQCFLKMSVKSCSVLLMLSF